jgi:glycosyltransferase involved in cell wall biosynthesis
MGYFEEIAWFIACSSMFLGIPMARQTIQLILFFSRSVSLHVWDRKGILEREVALYRRLQAYGVQVTFVTYGDRADLAYAEQLPGVTILCNRWQLHPQVYAVLLPWLHAPWLQRCQVIKTNQLNGGEVALWAARAWRKPLIARCGYMWSLNTARKTGANSRVARRAKRIENQVFCAAQHIVVTTTAMADDVAQRFPTAIMRTTVLPNYVNIEEFRPLPDSTREWDLIFIGRLSPEKNVEALLEAIAPLDVRLLLIGNGELRESLQQRFGDLNGRVQWRERVPHTSIPALLNRSRVFVLPSHYEGHPKALIEAMACGRPVLAADSPGIREMIRHRETGYLCATDAASIRAAIQVLLVDDALQTTLGDSARQFAVANYSLERIAAQEFQILQQVAAL